MIGKFTVYIYDEEENLISVRSRMQYADYAIYSKDFNSSDELLLFLSESEKLSEFKKVHVFYKEKEESVLIFEGVYGKNTIKDVQDFVKNK